MLANVAPGPNFAAPDSPRAIFHQLLYSTHTIVAAPPPQTFHESTPFLTTNILRCINMHMTVLYQNIMGFDWAPKLELSDIYQITFHNIKLLQTGHQCTAPATGRGPGLLLLPRPNNPDRKDIFHLTPTQPPGQHWAEPGFTLNEGI